MKKIIFFNLPMKSMENNEACFFGKGNIDCKYEGKVKFGLIAALYGTISQNDNILVVINKTNSNFPNDSDKNIDFFKQEFKDVLKIDLIENKNLKIVKSPFTESRQDMQTLYREYLNLIEEEDWLYADTTFGPRLNLPIIFSLFNFAEKFFDAEVKLLLNVKASFGKGNVLIEDSQALYDISPFYSLTNLTNAMKAKSGEQAVKMLDDFFNL